MSCKNNGIISSDHFVQVDKMVALGSNSIQEIEDIKLTRYACYLIAQNGDPRKTKIAFASTILRCKPEDLRNYRADGKYRKDRIKGKLKESEKEFGRVVYDRGVGSQDLDYLNPKATMLFLEGIPRKI